MNASRLLPLCVVLLSLACAGAKGPSTDDGPAASSSAGKVDEGGADNSPAATCSSDAECVPAQCCHPTSCVPASQAPDCSDMFCTEVCEGGTMDCGQGHCACLDGLCTAVIDNPF